jgi:hypothetical protein
VYEHQQPPQHQIVFVYSCHGRLVLLQLGALGALHCIIEVPHGTLLHMLGERQSQHEGVISSMQDADLENIQVSLDWSLNSIY